MTDLEDKNDQSHLIKKKFTSSEDEGALSQDQKEVNINFLLRLWYALKGYALDDAEKLYKASVNSLEAKANKQHYENKKIDAEATEKYMKAELTKQKAIKKEIENERERVKVEKEKLKLRSEELEVFEKKVKAFERLENAINTIKAKNGEVFSIKNKFKKFYLSSVKM